MSQFETSKTQSVLSINLLWKEGNQFWNLLMSTTTFWKSRERLKSSNSLPSITGILQLEQKAKIRIQQRAQWHKSSFWIEVYRTLKIRIYGRNTTSFWKAKSQKLKMVKSFIRLWNRNSLWRSLLNKRRILCLNISKKRIISLRSKLMQLLRRMKTIKKRRTIFFRSSLEGLQGWILNKQLDRSWGEIQNCKKVRSPKPHYLPKHLKQFTLKHQRTLVNTNFEIDLKT